MVCRSPDVVRRRGARLECRPRRMVAGRPTEARLVVTNSQTPAVRIFDADPPPARDPVLLRLLAGAPPEDGAESLRRHRFRLGAEWSPEHGESFIEALRDSGLTGRGGGRLSAGGGGGRGGRHTCATQAGGVG